MRKCECVREIVCLFGRGENGDREIVRVCQRERERGREGERERGRESESERER